MKNIYFIAALIISATFLACSNHKENAAELYNQTASLTATDLLNFNPLQWKVITAAGNKNNNTMCTLYGNDTAIFYARSGKGNVYPQGSVLSLVTWKQQDDKHWFGAKIPQQILSVEVLKFSPEGTIGNPVYETYEGTPLRLKKQNAPADIAIRSAYITGLKAVVTP